MMGNKCCPCIKQDVTSGMSRMGAKGLDTKKEHDLETVNEPTRQGPLEVYENFDIEKRDESVSDPLISCEIAKNKNSNNSDQAPEYSKKVDVVVETEE